MGELDPFLAPTQLVPQMASQSVNHSLLILWCNLQSCEKTIQHYLPFGPCDWTAIMASSLRYFLISDRKSAICWSYTNNTRADLTDIFQVDWVIRQPIWSYGRLLAWGIGLATQRFARLTPHIQVTTWDNCQFLSERHVVIISKTTKILWIF